MSEPRSEYPTEVVASLYTGVMLCHFNDMHEAAERLTGGPVWTHEFALESQWNVFRRGVLAQHPGMEAVVVELPCDVPAVVADLHGRFGPTLRLDPMPDYRRSRHPLNTLREVAGDKPIVAVEVDDGASPEAVAGAINSAVRRLSDSTPEAP